MRLLKILTWSCVPLFTAACAAGPNRLCFYQKNDWEYLSSAPAGVDRLISQLANTKYSPPNSNTQRKMWFRGPDSLYLCVQQRSLPRANDSCGAVGYKFNLVNGTYQFDGHTRITSC